MDVRTLCLAILHESDASGYEIRKLSTEGEYAHFVKASFGSIYPALAKLEDDGLVTSRVENQDGRPAKKVYAITEAGKNTFHDSLFDELGEDEFRSEFFLFALFAKQLPASLVETRIKERISCLEKKISNLNNLLDEREAACDAWVINYGLVCLEVALEHIRSHMHELIAMARPDDGSAKAAE